MGNPNFGIVIKSVDNDPRPIVAADLSTIGLIGVAADADANIFPINTPVLINSNDTAKMVAMGEDGDLADALRGINDQLGDTQFAARVVIIRVAASTNADPVAAMKENITNILGNSTSKTGMWAFTKAVSMLGVTPRLIIAPGYTGQMANWVSTVTQVLPGTNYVNGQSYALTFSSGGAGAVQAVGHAIGQANGSLGPAILDSQGSWYTSAPTIVAAAPPSGTTATYTAAIAAGANPVAAGLTPILNQLLAHAIIETAGTSQTNDLALRETMQSDRLILVTGGVRVIDPTTGNIVTRPIAPRIAGIAVRRDFEKGAPFHSWANQAIQGIVGPAREIPFSLTDDANEGQELLAANIGILVRGEVGNEFAIAQGGFVFIGTDNLGEDELWRFYNQKRGRDFIHLMLIRALRFYLGRYNITIQTVEALLLAEKYMLRDLKADGHIIDYKVAFRTDGNSAEEIRLGHITIGFAAEEPAPLKVITVESARMRSAVDAMIADLASQLDLAA